MIDIFKVEYAWLSNFYEVSITYHGICYKSVEAAYQAEKFLASPEETYSIRTGFTQLSPGEAKRRGPVILNRSDWDDIKLSIMEELLRMKFNQDFFKYHLIRTGDQELCEGNWWHDNFWGSCLCDKCKNQGQNHLGRLLMRIRHELQNESPRNVWSSVHIPDGTRIVRDYAFCGCSDLNAIFIPDNVTKIGNQAFRGCSGLTAVHIPDNVTEIGSHAFSGCTGLTDIRIPQGVKK